MDIALSHAAILANCCLLAVIHYEREMYLLSG